MASVCRRLLGIVTSSRTTKATVPAVNNTVKKPKIVASDEVPAVSNTVKKPKIVASAAVPAASKTVKKPKSVPSAAVPAVSNSVKKPKSIAVATQTETTAGGKRNTFLKMVSRFKKSSGLVEFRSRGDIYTNTVQRLAKYQRFSMIRDILDHQKNFEDIRDELFTSRLVRLYGKAGMFDEARKLFDEMPDLNCPRTVYSFNSLLDACVEAGRVDEMESIVNDLPDKLGISLDVTSYNVIIKGFLKQGDVNSAASMLDRMLEKGVNPNVITFNSLFWGFYGEKRSVDGDRIWDRMVQMNVLPEQRSYNAKLYGLALEQRMEEAAELLEEMRSTGIETSVYSFNPLIKSSVQDDNLEEAKRWYGEIGKANLSPDKVTFRIILPFLCSKGDLDFAIEVCEEIFSTKCLVHSELLQQMVNGLVEQSKITEAKKLVELGRENGYHSLKLPSNV